MKITFSAAGYGVPDSDWDPLSAEAYLEFLNELGVPFEDLRSNGGNIPDDADYGDWIRRHDKVGWNMGYQEYVANELFRRGSQ